MMKIMVDFPDHNQELEIVNRMSSQPPEPHEIMSIGELEDLQKLTSKVFVDSSVSQYAVDLVMATRTPDKYGLSEIKPLVEFGVSPRATLALLSGAKAMAIIKGRTYCTAQDVFDITRDVFRHRLLLTYEALAKDVKPDDVINRILTVVPAAAIATAEN